MEWRRGTNVLEIVIRLATRWDFAPITKSPKMQWGVPMRFFPEFKDQGEVIASFGDAKLIRFLDGKMELRGGSGDDRTAAREWMSMFRHEAVVGER
jgi:hypothetical protein